MQHAADLVQLSSIPEVNPAMDGKMIECIQVDAERHLQQGTLCTVVTSRFSDGSYLNKVELQNGCLALGHHSVFIPSTIHGSNLDSDGKLHMERLKQNLESAMDVYINTVSGSLCFGTEILLVKGAVGEENRIYNERCTNFRTFLLGPKKKLEVLRRSHPEDFKYFSKIWEAHGYWVAIKLHFYDFAML